MDKSFPTPKLASSGPRNRAALIEADDVEGILADIDAHRGNSRV
jgi:hypothetical protein